MQSYAINNSETLLPESVKMTPMLKQWCEAKSKAKDALLLFRMGDFYELFADDAVKAAPVLELALTSRDKEKGDASVAMAGFPHHSAPSHIAKLIAQGFKVAICDQLEDPKAAKGIVKRDITQIVTPGTLIDDEALPSGENNFLVGVLQKEKMWGLAAIDWSTGEFVATRMSDFESVLDELSRLSPSEVLLSTENDAKDPIDTIRMLCNKTKSCLVQEVSAEHKVRKELFSTPLDDWFWEKESLAALFAAQLVLSYLNDAQGNSHEHIQAPRPYAAEQFLIVDAVSQRHLNLANQKNGLTKSASLLGTINQTKTAMGMRMMRKWICFPSAKQDEILKRHDAVELLMARPDLRRMLREILQSMYDLERITARAAIGRVSPRELGNLRDSLVKLPRIRELVAELGGAVEKTAPIEDLSELESLLVQSLAASPPIAIADGGIFTRGFDAELDELNELAQGGREKIAAIELREREATQISSLKVGFTRVFGYYIEVTRTNLSKVPDHYKRKQTIANGERYITEELIELEEMIASAQAKRLQRETHLFEELRKRVEREAQRLLQAASSTAKLDVLCSFAQCAEQNRYIRPTILEKEQQRFEVRQGRHPIIEMLLKQKGHVFIPNDTVLDKDGAQIVLVTGPNMAGKSTIMRQVALIQILAQAGSFVPAESAVLSICDRIFTRVGASDDIDEGRSTFMVEMAETAQILKHATPHSLVLLDEIGRGTSTYDGLSIAWSVAEYMHDHVRARTLFATHYHEITALEQQAPRIKNMHVAVDESARGIEFLYLLREGPAMRSYGIHVAKLAGLPRKVLDRASTLLSEFEAAKERPLKNESSQNQMDLFGSALSKEDKIKIDVAHSLRDLDVDSMCAKDALDWIYRQIGQLRSIQ